MNQMVIVFSLDNNVIFSLTSILTYPVNSGCMNKQGMKGIIKTIMYKKN